MRLHLLLGVINVARIPINYGDSCDTIILATFFAEGRCNDDENLKDTTTANP